MEEFTWEKLKLTGLSSKDKIGKYPLAGLVWAISCPAQGCPVVMGADTIALEKGKSMGLILWIYLNIEGGFSIDGELTIAKLYPARLSLGIKKPRGGDFEPIHSLKRISSSGRLLEISKFKGKANFQVKAGVSTELDFIAAGVRIVNSGLDTLGQLQMGITGEASYGTDSLNLPWDLKTDACFTTSIGAGAIARASANFGVKFDTKWKNISKERGFEYGGQWPTDDEMNSPGWHYGWYNVVGEEICTIKTVTSATGRIWMDRNLGASRVATSMTDTEAYGDLYQWGRGKDGHEKRTSDTTATVSSTDAPGHGNFITADDWRSPHNSNLWQGVNEVNNNPCPAGFRLPTAAEFDQERLSWPALDAAGAFASPLKLVTAGARMYFNGSLGGMSTTGFYWSSTDDGNSPSGLYFDSSTASGLNSYYGYGFSVRCIKEDQFKEYQNHLYKLVDTATTSWHDAKNYCANQGGHLVTISSSDEQQFVNSIAHKIIWLGGTDEGNEDNWSWITGEPWNYSNWDVGIPDNCCPQSVCGGSGCTPQHYLMFYENGIWNDMSEIEIPLPFVCEWDSLERPSLQSAK